MSIMDVERNQSYEENSLFIFKSYESLNINIHLIIININNNDDDDDEQHLCVLPNYL